MHPDIALSEVRLPDRLEDDARRMRRRSRASKVGRAELEPGEGHSRSPATRDQRDRNQDELELSPECVSRVLLFGIGFGFHLTAVATRPKRRWAQMKRRALNDRSIRCLRASPSLQSYGAGSSPRSAHRVQCRRSLDAVIAWPWARTIAAATYAASAR